MPRPLVIGNGNILVNFDDKLNIRDFYYPHVGMYNHLSGHKIRMGVWVDGLFAWIETDEWKRELSYLPSTLITNVTATNLRLGLKLKIRDVVCHRENAYLKEIVVENLTKQPRECRVFFSHDFHIMETDIGDTAFYYPFADSMIHYKLHNYFLIGGSTQQGGIYEYATGIKGFQHYEGTWRDAEDGSLSNNPIAQGSVDSTISFVTHLPSAGKEIVRYWIVADNCLENVVKTYHRVMHKGFDDSFTETANYWEAWVSKAAEGIKYVPNNVAELFKRSLLVMRTQIDNDGAVTAANDSDIMETARANYSYMWPRDGAYVASVLDQVGYPHTTRKFFRFCKKILPTDRPALMHKYHADGSMGASWHPWVVDGHAEVPFQEDGTALLIWALRKHYERYRDIEFLDDLFEDFVVPIADFLMRYRDGNMLLPKPSWDLWEERRGVHTFTAACVHASLVSASRIAKVFGDSRSEYYENAADELKTAITKHLWNPTLKRFARCLFVHKDGSVEADMTLDSSILALPLLGVLSPFSPQVVSTVNQLKKKLWVNTHIGGMSRYENDYYFRISDDAPGNPWFICTLWLADYQILTAKTIKDLEEPLAILEWTAEHAMSTGILPEQINAMTGTPLSVAPLTWSHAQFSSTVMNYINKRNRIGGGNGNSHEIIKSEGK